MTEEFNHWGNIANALPDVLSQAVRKTAFDWQAGYVRRAPRDTGFMANSAYVVTSDSSTYGQGQSPAKKGASLLPEVEKPEEKTTAYVAVGANYGLFVEMGTVHQPAQPAFIPAAEDARKSFDAALSAVEGKLKEAAK